MDNENSKISIRQLFIIFVISIASPLTRVLPKYCGEIAKQATWLTPILAIIPFMLLIYVLNNLFTKTKLGSLEDIYIKIFGKIIGKTVLFMHIIWIITMIALYVRYFADRLTSSIFIFSPMQFFMITILLMTYLVVRNKIEYFGRFMELYNKIFLIFLIISIFVGLSDVKLPNILPITTYDIGPVFISIVPLFGILGYITFMFFLGDKVANKDKLKNYTKQLYLSMTFLSVVIVMITIGIFGYKLTGNLNLSFFIFFKDIEILSIIERVESIFLCVWIVTDFAIISIFMFIVVKLIKKFFNLNTSKELVTPVIFIVYVYAQYIASNLFELSMLSKNIFLYINVGLGCIIPISAFIIGKIRKIV
ncbi:MAG: GerAB/ArcD/ProY family transporter [Clostridia bacterium]|nr:GerAB/ArcD/ProY family transporter [Clostridia bacterium]